MIVYNSYPVADSANLLAGTDLATAPSKGLMKFYCVSTQMDTLWTILVPNQPVVLRNLPSNVKTVANVDLSTDIPYMVEVNGGEQIVVSVDETTAMTAAFCCVFMTENELRK